MTLRYPRSGRCGCRTWIVRAGFDKVRKKVRGTIERHSIGKGSDITVTELGKQAGLGLAGGISLHFLLAGAGIVSAAGFTPAGFLVKLGLGAGATAIKVAANDCSLIGAATTIGGAFI